MKELDRSQDKVSKTSFWLFLCDGIPYTNERAKTDSENYVTEDEGTSATLEAFDFGGSAGRQVTENALKDAPRMR